MALRSAVFVSGVAAVLSVVAARIPPLSAVGSIWVISASLTTLALYQRRRPLASMNANVGARIGLLVGMVLVFLLAATLSAGLCVGRYGLHNLSELDSGMAQMQKLQIEQMDQLSTSRPIPPEIRSLVGSSQFRAAMMLCYFSLILFAVFLISIFGGAVGGLLRTRRFGRKA